MQVRIKGRCRGEGKTYVWIQAHVSEGSRLFASSVNVEGDSLPCKLLPLGIMPREGWHECVLVVFTMNRRQFVTFSELDAAGNTVSSVKRTIIPLHSTWASRANGVLRKELCAKIRNFDWKGLARQSILTLCRRKIRGSSEAHYSFHAKTLTMLSYRYSTRAARKFRLPCIFCLRLQLA